MYGEVLGVLLPGHGTVYLENGQCSDEETAKIVHNIVTPAQIRGEDRLD